MALCSVRNSRAPEGSMSYMPCAMCSCFRPSLIYWQRVLCVYGGDQTVCLDPVWACANMRRLHPKTNWSDGCCFRGKLNICRRPVRLQPPCFALFAAMQGSPNPNTLRTSLKIALAGMSCVHTCWALFVNTAGRQDILLRTVRSYALIGARSRVGRDHSALPASSRFPRPQRRTTPRP